MEFTKERVRSPGWRCSVMSFSEAASIAAKIPTPDGLTDRHIELAAEQVIAEGLVPRDSTVLDRARKLAAAESPKARSIWEALDLRPAWWNHGVHPSIEGSTLVLAIPRRWAEYVATKVGPQLRERLAALPEAEGIERMVVRPYGPEAERKSRPAPTYREQRRAAA